MDYSSIVLSAGQIETGKHMKYLGGGSGCWEKRGEFQLELLRFFGLNEGHTLLDVGCGPLRAGVHFIRYLSPNSYFGVDYNDSFIQAAHRVLDQEGFSAHKERVRKLDSFDFASLNRQFDYILCFSVLNHCSQKQRAEFFQRVRFSMKAESRLFVTHADWFEGGELSGLRVVQVIYSEKDLPPYLSFSAWDFDGVKDRLPIIEFGLKSGVEDA